MKSNLMIVFLLVLTACVPSRGQEKLSPDLPWSTRIAESFLQRYPEAIPYNAGSPQLRWNYEQGLMQEALRRVGEVTRNKKYYEYVKRNIDQYVMEDGSIKTYEYENFNIDNIPPGRQLLMLFQTTGDAKYRKAADLLRKQLSNQPRTPSKGFWHKQIYPNQMWLDGIYMAQPFYAEYAVMVGEHSVFNDVVHQIILIEKKTRDPKSGLLYHGWDESKEQRWADPQTGRSPNFWGRAMGWYAMGVVDVLDVFPSDHPKRGEIIAVLRRLAKALVKYQDEKTGLWYQVVDQGNKDGNYLEASASCMFAYALAKGARMGYLEKRFRANAEKAFQGILTELVTVDEKGLVDLHHVCAVAGLGGNPYRDGSFEYYISEPQRSNDFKGLGPFLLAALEMERLTQTRDKTR